MKPDRRFPHQWRPCRKPRTTVQHPSRRGERCHAVSRCVHPAGGERDFLTCGAFKRVLASGRGLLRRGFLGCESCDILSRSQRIVCDNLGGRNWTEPAKETPGFRSCLAPTPATRKGSAVVKIHDLGAKVDLMRNIQRCCLINNTKDRRSRTAVPGLLLWREPETAAALC